MEGLAAHLGTNYIPTDNEMLAIRAMLPFPRLKLANLRADIARHEAAIQHLAAEHNALLHQINSYHALISPARRLPADIVRAIFLHCLPGELHLTMSSREAPVLLTRICSAWRGIALTTPALWASIHVPVPPCALPALYPGDEASYLGLATQTVNRRLEGVRQWIARSGAMPLHISLVDKNPPGVVRPNAFVPPFLDVLVEHASRWRWARFNITSEHFIRIAKIPANDVSLLVTLNIVLIGCCATHRIPSEFRWQDSTIVKAPRLRMVSFVHPMYTLNALPFRWTQLTHLTLSDLCTQTTMSISDIMALLIKCTNLVAVKIAVPALTTLPTQEVAENIVMPHLRSLVLEDHGGCIPSFWLSLHLPVLESFTYHAVIPSANAPLSRWTSLSYFFLHAKNRLYYLAINSSILNAPMLSAILERCPNLKSLSTNLSAHLTDELLVMMNRDGHCLVPNLEVLEFKSPSPSAITESAVLNFIRERQGGRVPGVSKLKHMTIQLARPRGVSSPDELAQYVAEGLKLQLLCPSKPLQGPFSL